MTIELVDGKAGVAHISSEDKAIIHQAKFSKSDVVFDWGDSFKCSMSSSNRATIGTGCASIQGLDWHITSAESVTISNGSQGMKRNDIICAHYNRNPKTGNELVELVVLKGSPNATAAADPKVPSGKILSGAVDAYMPLWRIPLDGITVGTPVRLFTPRGALWDSVTTDAYHLTAVARTAAFCHNDDLYRCLDGRNWKRYAANMPCVCGNGRIIRCAEGNRVSHDVQKMVLHPLFRGIVYEHVEGFAGGLHVHACQSHSSPRLIAESPFVDPSAVDGRQAIDDASADCEFRVGGQFRETNRGYGIPIMHIPHRMVAGWRPRRIPHHRAPE